MTNQTKLIEELELANLDVDKTLSKLSEADFTSSLVYIDRAQSLERAHNVALEKRQKIVSKILQK